jgi:FKBP-type peptidyl-prolyl cis-trans isomerase FkpA
LPQSRRRRSGKARKRPRGPGASAPTVTKTAQKERTVRVVAIAVVAVLALSAAGLLFKYRRGQGPNEITTASGLKYVDDAEGTGPTPQNGQMVSVNYTGMLESGKQFGASPPGKPLEFRLGMGDVIKGWDEGIASMKVGGKRKLIIPAKLGYGAAGRAPDIPGNATLIFDVELVSIK